MSDPVEPDTIVPVLPPVEQDPTVIEPIVPSAPELPTQDARGNDVRGGLPRIEYALPDPAPSVERSKASRFGHLGGTVPL